MQHDKVEALVQFILATARLEVEDWNQRALGPIHIIKYVYLADLAYAERHGECFTGVPWQFHNFGPWSAELQDHLPQAVALANADARPFDNMHGAESIRWKIADTRTAERALAHAEPFLPTHVKLLVKQAVKRFGNDTSELLEHVYATTPMTRVAPREPLSFDDLMVAPARQMEPPPTLRPKALKRRKEMLGAARARFAKRAESLPRAETQPPVYDEVFESALRLLDANVNADVAKLEGVLEFDDAVWHSPARSGWDDD